jgi:hypothetical protein
MGNGPAHYGMATNMGVISFKVQTPGFAPQPRQTKKNYFTTKSQLNLSVGLSL